MIDHTADLMRCVLEDPADDAARLILADWLEERGDTAHADFIRVSIDLANTGLHDCPTPTYRMPSWGPTNAQGRQRLRCGGERCPFCRHAVILENICRGYTDSTVLSGVPFACSHTWESPHIFLPRTKDGWPSLYLRRGFVEVAEMECDSFMRSAKALFSNQPVTRVRLTDKQPWSGKYMASDEEDNLFGWWSSANYSGRNVSDPNSESTLDTELMGTLDVLFDSDTDAVEALSDACVALGRRRAGLLELSRKEQ